MRWFLTKEGVSVLENEYSKVKVNNEIDFCSVTEQKVKTILEKAFMKVGEKSGLYSVSILLRWRLQMRY